MVLRLKIIYILLILIFASQLTAQVSNVKLDNDVYKYLSNLSSKGLIDYNDLVKPLSRRYIAEKLIEVRVNFARLTDLQKDELQFYEAEYGFEISRQKEMGKWRKGEIKDEEERMSGCKRCIRYGYG